MTDDTPNLYDWKPLRRRPRRAAERSLAMGGPERVERQRVDGEVAGARSGSTCCSTPVRSSSSGSSPTRWTRGWPTRDTSRPTAASPASARSTAGGSAVVAYDFTVMAGSMGAVNEVKTARMREVVLRQRMPIVWLLDSAGARIQSTSGSTFAGAGALFREQVTLSGVVPQVAALHGPLRRRAPRTSPRWPTSCRWSRARPRWRSAGRHLVKAATGEDVTEEEMGGSAVHNKISGVADLEVADDAECLATIKRYLSFFPQHNQEAPPVIAVDDPVDRRIEAVYDIVPTAPRRAYDTKRVIERRRRRRRLLRDEAASGRATS